MVTINTNNKTGDKFYLAVGNIAHSHVLFSRLLAYLLGFSLHKDWGSDVNWTISLHYCNLLAVQFGVHPYLRISPESEYQADATELSHLRTANFKAHHILFLEISGVALPTTPSKIPFFQYGKPEKRLSFTSDGASYRKFQNGYLEGKCFRPHSSWSRG